MMFVFDGVIVYAHGEVLKNGMLYANGVYDITRRNFEMFDYIDGAEDGDLFDGETLTKSIKQSVIVIPKSVTPRQARLALLQATLLDEVELLLANDKTMQIWWEYSLDIERNHEHIAAMGAALGLSSEQLDELFILAATL